MNIGLVILAVYIAVLLGIALYASKKDKKNIKDFATGGGLGIFILTLTFSATYHSAYAFMGAGGFAYKNGIGWWCNGLWTVLPGVLFWVWGRRFWYLGKRYGYLSVSDYASDVYQSKTVGILVTLITMVFTIPYVAIQAIGCSYIFQTISGGMLSYTVGALIFFAIMIVLVWLGGMKGVAITDAAQGVIGRLLMPDIAAPDTIFPELLLKYTPAVFAALIISGALAAAMSTGDSQLHATSTMVATDIYKKFVDKKANENTLYNVAKIGVLIIGLASVVFALTRPTALADLLVLSNGGVAVLVPAVIGGLYWKKASRGGAIASIVIGEICMVSMTFIFKVSPFGFSGALCSMLISLIIFVSVSFITKPQAHTSEVISSINSYFAEDKAAEETQNNQGALGNLCTKGG